jgi:hypothetical protein
MRRYEKMVWVAGGLGVAFLAGRLLHKAESPASPSEHVDCSAYDLARISYAETLDATKHQDDKVGRFLTTIAFLTAAAITFGTRTDVLRIQYNLDGLVPLPAVLFGAFFALVVVAVIFLLMALGQTLGLPPSQPSSGRTERKSRLFFLVISGDTLENWLYRWKGEVSGIRDDLEQDFISETHNIATRADRKYRRTGEAQAIFTIALVLFGLAVTLALNVLARQKMSPAPWDLRSRLLAGAVLTTFAASMGYGWVRSDQVLGAKAQWQRYALWALATGYPASVLLPPLGVSRGIGSIVGGAVVLVGGLVAITMTRTAQSQVVIGSLSIALAIATGATVWMEAERWRLILACGSVAMFEVPRLLSATFVWRRRQGALTRSPGQPVLRRPAAMPLTVSSSARRSSGSGSLVARSRASNAVCR